MPDPTSSPIPLSPLGGAFSALESVSTGPVVSGVETGAVTTSLGGFTFGGPTIQAPTPREGTAPPIDFKILLTIVAAGLLVAGTIALFRRR